MRNSRIMILGLILGAATAFHSPLTQTVRAQPTEPLAKPDPIFSEVFSVVQTNLPYLSESQLNRAAVFGFLKEMEPHITWLDQETSPGSGPALTKISSFENTHGYIRVNHIAAGFGQALRDAYQQLSSSNKLIGVILDLRFARGTDYSAAAEGVDQFLSTANPLLKWGEITASSSPKSNPLSQPTVLLVNAATHGAPEAFAAAFRQNQLGLLVGSPTAGKAAQTKDFTLSTGQRLRLPIQPIQLSDGKNLSGKKLEPDILVQVPLEDEQAYFEDPYKRLPRLSAQRRLIDPLADRSAAATNRVPRRRLNEAELVRMQREGIDPNTPSPNQIISSSPAKPILADPVLARAFDLLKGLAVVRNRQ